MSSSNTRMKEVREILKKKLAEKFSTVRFLQEIHFKLKA